jgi:hypothetical protein
VEINQPGSNPRDDIDEPTIEPAGTEAVGPAADRSGSRYCSICGEIYSAAATVCPHCGAPRRDPPQLDFRSLSAVLTDLPLLKATAGLDAPSSNAIQRTLEGWLLERRPRRPDVAAVLRGNAAVRPSDAVSAAPAKPKGATIGDWTAARQADILLYLGALFLSVAAFVFVGYQGNAISGPVRFVVLLAYTAAFLGLGLSLPRWQRVREAGTVFLGLGAILVPVNFFALRTLVLGSSAVPDSALWLIGAAVTAALYLVLGVRGFGRPYVLVGALACLVGWGALEAVLAFPIEWTSAWFLALAAAVNGVWSLARRPGRELIEIACIAIGACALLAAHAGAIDGHYRAELPMAYALACIGMGFSAYRRSLPACAPLPTLLALTAFTACWAFFDTSPAWFACFAAGAAGGYLLLGSLDIAARRDSWRMAALLAGCFALLWAHSAAVIGGPAAVLPGTYAILLALAAWDGFKHRDEALTLLPAVAAMTGSTVLWAAGVTLPWWGYPWIAAALGVLATAPWWQREPKLRPIGWAYLAGIAGLPPLLMVSAGIFQTAPAHGAVELLLAGCVLVAVALSSRGDLTALLRLQLNRRALMIEQHTLVRIASAYVLGAAGYFNAYLGVTGSGRAWVYIGIGMALWLGIALAGGLRPDLFAMLAPSAFIASALAVGLAWQTPGMAALLAGLAAAGAALAFTIARRWPACLLAAGFAFTALAFAWNWLGLDLTLLPVAYVACSTVLWAALTPVRRYVATERGIAILGLSWLPWVVAFGAGMVLLDRRLLGLVDWSDIAQTREWAVLILTIAAPSLAVVLEGVHLRRRAVVIPGSAGLLLAALMAIAIARPDNVQSFTVPIGVYLILLGLSFRRSAPLLADQMYLHEAAIVAGACFLVLPPASQSFANGEQGYLLELIAEGVILLVLGFVVSSRWLVAGGVLTFTGVAIRALAVFGTHAPYWLTLGLVGTLCLLVGLLLLVHRDRWDRARHRLGRWWLEQAPAASADAGS